MFLQTNAFWKPVLVLTRVSELADSVMTLAGLRHLCERWLTRALQGCLEAFWKAITLFVMSVRGTELGDDAFLFHIDLSDFTQEGRA